MAEHKYKNFAILIGKVIDCEESDLPFREVTLRVNRRNNQMYDDIPVLVAKKFIEEFGIGDVIRVIGSIRLFRNRTSTWQKNRQMMLASNLWKMNQETNHMNHVEIQGDIYKVLPIQVLPTTKEYIKLTSFSINIPRDSIEKGYHGDIISCVSWNSQALISAIFIKGDKVRIVGRFQTRSFKKQHDDCTTTLEKVYEVSCFKVERVY